MDTFYQGHERLNKSSHTSMHRINICQITLENTIGKLTGGFWHQFQKLSTNQIFVHALEFSIHDKVKFSNNVEWHILAAIWAFSCFNLSKVLVKLTYFQISTTSMSNIYLILHIHEWKCTTVVYDLKIHSTCLTNIYW